MLQAIKSFFGHEAKSAPAGLTSDQLHMLFGATPTAAGVAVSPDSAMRCPAVYASVKVLAESVAQLPLILYRRTAEGGKERAADHPLYSLLHDQVNDWTSAAEWRLEMQAALCQHGRAYSFVNRAGGRVAEIIQLPTPSVSVRHDPVTMEPTYSVTDAEGRQRDYDRTEIMELRTLGGLSPVMQAREAVALALALEGHAARLMGNGGRPSGVLKYGKFLSADMAKRLKAMIDQTHSGTASGGTMVLEDGMEFSPLAFSSVDMQFAELRRFQIGEIARVFRIPLHMLQDLERTTHNNAEHMGRQFLAFTLLPWLKLWEGGIRRSLLTEDERRDYVAEFLTDDLARADLAQRFDAYAKAVTNGLLSPNEVRAAENRPPYVGGDQFRLPLNTEDANGGSADAAA